jgi:hypothetical protein
MKHLSLLFIFLSSCYGEKLVITSNQKNISTVKVVDFDVRIKILKKGLVLVGGRYYANPFPLKNCKKIINSRHGITINDKDKIIKHGTPIMITKSEKVYNGYFINCGICPERSQQIMHLSMRELADGRINEKLLSINQDGCTDDKPSLKYIVYVVRKRGNK